jgi:Flp pilus assembly secretin CpaC
MLLSLLLGPNIGAAQSERAAVAPKIGVESWLLVGGDEFKRRFESISPNSMMAPVTATRLQLTAAVDADEVTVLADSRLLSKDGTPAQFTSRFEVPVPGDGSPASVPDENLAIRLSVTPTIQPDGAILLAFDIELQTLTTKLVIGAAELSGRRSQSGKVLLPPGDAVLLNLSSRDPEALGNPIGVKGEDLLLLLAPAVVVSETER